MTHHFSQGTKTVHGDTVHPTGQRSSPTGGPLDSRTILRFPCLGMQFLFESVAVQSLEVGTCLAWETFSLRWSSGVQSEQRRATHLFVARNDNLLGTDAEDDGHA